MVLLEVLFEAKPSVDVNLFEFKLFIGLAVHRYVYTSAYPFIYSYIHAFI